jgi:hypothetical protein
MDKPETKPNDEWTSQRQSQMMNGQARDKAKICLCLSFVHSSFAFVSRLSILHLPLSLVCPFFICLYLWLVHSSFGFVSGLSIHHLALWTSQRQSQMKNGQTRDKGK